MQAALVMSICTELHLEILPICNNFLEHLGYVHVKQATPAPLQGEALTPLARMGPHHPERLGLKTGNLLMPLNTEVEGGGLAGAIGHH